MIPQGYKVKQGVMYAPDGKVVTKRPKSFDDYRFGWRVNGVWIYADEFENETKHERAHRLRMYQQKRYARIRREKVNKC